eukprot:g13918.t1
MPENPLYETTSTREFRLSIQEHEDLTGKVCLFDKVVDRVVEHEATFAILNALDEDRRSVFSNGRTSRIKMGRSSGTARVSGRTSRTGRSSRTAGISGGSMKSMVRLSSRGSIRRSSAKRKKSPWEKLKAIVSKNSMFQAYEKDVKDSKTFSKYMPSPMSHLNCQLDPLTLKYNDTEMEKVFLMQTRHESTLMQFILILAVGSVLGPITYPNYASIVVYSLPCILLALLVGMLMYFRPMLLLKHYDMWCVAAIIMYTLSNTLVNTMTRHDAQLLVPDINCYLQSYSIWVIALLWFANVATGMTYAFVAPTSLICALGNYLPTFSHKSSSPLDTIIDVLVMLGTVAIILMDTYEMELKRRRNFLISGGSMKWVEDDKVIKRWFRQQWSKKCCWLPCPCNILLTLKDKNLDAQYSRFASVQLMKYNSAVILIGCISLFLDFASVSYELRFNNAAEAKESSVNHAALMLPSIFAGGFLSIVPLLCVGITFHLYIPRSSSMEIPCVGKIGGARCYRMLNENKRLRILVTSATQVVLPVFIVLILILFPILMHETGEQLRQKHFPYNKNLTFSLLTWEKIVGDPSAYGGVICKDNNTTTSEKEDEDDANAIEATNITDIDVQDSQVTG